MVTYRLFTHTIPRRPKKFTPFRTGHFREMFDAGYDAASERMDEIHRAIERGGA